MLAAGIICIIIAIIGFLGGIASGDPLGPAPGALFFIGIGVFIICLKVIVFPKFMDSKFMDWIERKDEEHSKKKKEIKKKEQFQKAEQRFGNSMFVMTLIQDFRSRNWADLDYTSGGCQVLKNKIVTPKNTYLYDDYALNDLDIVGCELLAAYIGGVFANEYKIEKVERTYGAYTGGYSGYVGTNGNVHVYQDYESSTVTVGYKVYSEASLPPSKPKDKDW